MSGRLQQIKRYLANDIEWLVATAKRVEEVELTNHNLERKLGEERGRVQQLKMQCEALECDNKRLSRLLHNKELSE